MLARESVSMVPPTDVGQPARPQQSLYHQSQRLQRNGLCQVLIGTCPFGPSGQRGIVMGGDHDDPAFQPSAARWGEKLPRDQQRWSARRIVSVDLFGRDRVAVALCVGLMPAGPVIVAAIMHAGTLRPRELGRLLAAPEPLPRVAGLMDRGRGRRPRERRTAHSRGSGHLMGQAPSARWAITRNNRRIATWPLH
jgi:hypothetical protein